MDAVLAAAIYSDTRQHAFFVLHDKEEAAYFHNDLQNLLPEKEILLFPNSYKKPYQFEEVENANILKRAETLYKINSSTESRLVVTFPEALTEKVINRKSLLNHTLAIGQGEKIDLEFICEILVSYGFEKTEFVYEPGQFALRGGILDICSYGNEFPYRLETLGDEVESIRTFDPYSQLSRETVKVMNIIPNVQTQLLTEERQSLFDFVPPNTAFWFKDFELTHQVVGQYFDKAEREFNKILEKSGNTKVISGPDILFESASEFIEKSANFSRVEFGNKFYLEKEEEYLFDTEIQPSFHRNFEKITENLQGLENDGIKMFIAGESLKQLEKLEAIFEEINSHIHFYPLNVGLRSGFIDKQLKIGCYTDHELFDRFFRYKGRENHSKSKAMTLRELNTLQIGDFVTHVDYGIGKFAGLEKKTVNGKDQEAIRLVYRDDDLLYINIHSLHKISRYSGKEGAVPAISKLGSPDWENKKKKVKKKVADIARELIDLYAKRKGAPGFTFSKDTYMQAELETGFLYEDTPDQVTSTAEVKEDMESPHPMDRLICGDVGFGKTEVAIRAAFKAVSDNKQVAVLVPTTILAMQHFRTFSERLSDFPVAIDYISRFKPQNEIKEILKKTGEGKIDILIGTHRIVSKDIKFKNIGLLIVDEEQKFGVKIKEKIKELKVNVDVLTLTATPIPRTLHFSLMGARDLSIIATPPPNRQPVTTEIHTFNDVLIRDAISYEIGRGGQVFFIHNRVRDIETMANKIYKLVPDAKIGVAHGQMEGTKLEKAMIKFIEGDYDILISTNIVESGLDIPNANTIIINQAHMFGLSDLHQMRGRVGRSNRKAFCYLLTPPTIGLSADARKRLKALEEFSELGDGYKVAMRDLDIRGAGNLLGAEQSGFITDIGFDMYHKILNEAISELKETEFKDLFKRDISKASPLTSQDCIIETDLELLIEEDYVSNTSERLKLYTELDNLKNEDELTIFVKNVTDRFGSLPTQALELISSIRLRWQAQSLGFEKLRLKNGTMRCYFLPPDNVEYYKSSVFGKILENIKMHPYRMAIKEVKGRPLLDIIDIENISDASNALKQFN